MEPVHYKNILCSKYTNFDVPDAKYEKGHIAFHNFTRLSFIELHIYIFIKATVKCIIIPITCMELHSLFQIRVFKLVVLVIGSFMVLGTLRSRGRSPRLVFKPFLLIFGYTNYHWPWAPCFSFNWSRKIIRYQFWALKINVTFVGLEIIKNEHKNAYVFH